MSNLLSRLEVYGSDPELKSDHRWVTLIYEVNRNGFFVLTICSKCGMLARKENSNTWELCKPSDDRWRMNELIDCPGHIEIS